jgi:hypothetical protein
MKANWSALGTRTVFCTAVTALLAIVSAAEITITGNALDTPITSELLTMTVAPPVTFSDIAVSGTDIYSNGVNNVGSIFQSGGDWDLDTTNSATRTMWVDFGDPHVPFNQQYVHGAMITHCKNNGLPSIGSLVGVGSSATCPMTFRINWGSSSSTFYRVEFNSIVHPGTGDVKFTCNAVASDNSCRDWTGLPADNDSTPGDGRSEGILAQVTTFRNTTTVTNLGTYEFAFHVHLTKP